MAMPSKKFSPEQKEFIRKTLEENSSRLEAQRLIGERYGKSMRTVRNWIKMIDEDISKSPEKDPIIEAAKVKEIKGKITFVSWAQESTPAHKGFMKNLEAYAAHHGAELAIIAGRYQNPTSIFKNPDELNWWDPLVIPHLTLNRHNIHPYVSVLSDVKVLPTAMNPMSGFEGFEGEVSLILGHPRVQFKVVPSLEGYRKKEIWTTGSCTVMNYTDSKAGKKGEFHHTIGFAIVENDGDDFYIRQVTADENGDFIDLNYGVADGVVTQGDDLVGVYCCGDKHFGETDMHMEMAGRGMIEKLKPEYVRLDDAFNGHSISHHEKKNPVQLYNRYAGGESLLGEELRLLKNSLDWYNKGDFKVIIPRCNHDDFFDRYIASQDWKKDIPNALEYIEATAILLKGDAPKGLIPYYIGQWYPDMITLGEDESFIVYEFEQSVHGHLGANGSRGSVVQYRRLSTKMVTMHTHSPSRYDGVLTGGTNTMLRLGYTKGPSSWSHCDILVHKNGKGQHLMFHNYKCTTFKI